MIRTTIKGDRWKIFVFESEEFVSKFGEGMSAFTDSKRKQVFFDSEDLDLEVVRHELFHAYASYLCLDAATLSNEQLEEIYAELFAKEGTKMIQQATDLFNKLRKFE